MTFASRLILLASFSLFAARALGADLYEVNPALLNLFGTNLNFRCHVDLRRNGASNAPPETLSFDLIRRGNRTRLDVDVDSVRNGPLPEILVDQLKRMGVKHALGMIDFEHRQMFIAYPALNACVENPVTLTETDPGRIRSGMKLIHGTEVFMGHKCRRCTRQISAGGNAHMTFDVWEAMDLHGFPLRIVQTDPGARLEFTVTKARFGGVNLAEFAVPRGCQRYGSMESLVLSKMIPFNLGQ